MKKINLILCLFFIISYCVSCSKTNRKEIIEESNIVENNSIISDATINPKENKYNFEILESELQKDLDIICAEPRTYGSLGEKRAMYKIVSLLKDYGYDAEIQEFSVYKQTFDSTLSVLGADYFNINPYNTESLGDGINIIATNNASVPTDKTLYITAHYDTVDNTKGVIDNGSGVISVLHIAKTMRNVDLNFNIKFIFFSAEEYHRQGSRNYLNNLSIDDRKKAIGCINLDMIGEEHAGEIVFKTLGKRTNLISYMFDEFSNYNCEDGGFSDDLSFYNAQIPVITLCNISPNLKKDNETEINLLEIKEITQELCYFVKYLSNEDIDKTLEERLIVGDEDLNNNLINNPNLELISSSNSFIGNGYETLTTYNFKYNSKDSVKIVEQINLDTNIDDISCYKAITNETNDNIKYYFDNWIYQLDEQKENNIKIKYIAANRRGTIEGNITLAEALDILERYYRNYHAF